MGVNSYINIGKKIKELRVKKGLKQKEVAKLLAIPVSTYSNYENGNREPNSKTIEKIAFVLDTTPEILIEIDKKSLEQDKKIIKISKYQSFIYAEMYSFIFKEKEKFQMIIEIALPKSLSEKETKTISLPSSYIMCELVFAHIAEDIIENYRSRIYSEVSSNWTSKQTFKNGFFNFDAQKVKLFILDYEKTIKSSIYDTIKEIFFNVMSRSKEYFDIDIFILEKTINDFIDNTVFIDTLFNLIKKELLSSIKFDFLTEFYYRLNETGRKKAFDYIVDLIEQPKYTDKE